jgi:hypothetical protein
MKTKLVAVAVFALAVFAGAVRQHAPALPPNSPFQ